MGADFIMMYRFILQDLDESPNPVLNITRFLCKGILGRGSNRARNWARYDDGEGSKLKFEEGVDSYAPYAGPLWR